MLARLLIRLIIVAIVIASFGPSLTPTVSANEPPVAVPDTGVIVREGQCLEIDVLGNDSDPDGDVLGIAAMGSGVYGTATWALRDNKPVQIMNYCAGAVDADTVDHPTYTLTDAQLAGGGPGFHLATGTVSVTVINNRLIAVEDAASVDEGSCVQIQVLGNDSDPDGDVHTSALATAATLGTVVDLGGGVFEYCLAVGTITENAGDGFTYTLTDGVDTVTQAVTLTLINVDDPVPTATSTPVPIETPVPPATAVPTETSTVIPPTSTATAPPRPQPIAVDDSVTMSQRTLAYFDVLANDISTGGAGLSIISLVGPPENVGYAAVEAGQVRLGTVSTFVGTTSFTYVATDGFGQSNVATVTVQVLPTPVVTGPANQTAVVGVETTFELGSFTDLDSAGPFHIFVSWGHAGNPPSVRFNVAEAGPIPPQSHTYDEPGEYFAYVAVSDGGGVSLVDYWQITVGDASLATSTPTTTATAAATETSTATSTAPANQPPVVTSPAAQRFGEGNSWAIDLGSFSDADGAGSWSVLVDWGDGGPGDAFLISTPGNLSVVSPGNQGDRRHRYVDDGTFTVAVMVTDNQGATGTATFDVQVLNVSPDVSGQRGQTALEGASSSFALGGFTDPGADDGPWAVTVNWGDGSQPTTFDVTTRGANALGTQDHTYADDGDYTVSVTVDDGDPNLNEGSYDETTATFRVSVNHRAPDLSAAVDQVGLAGVTGDVDLGSFSDYGSDDGPWVISVRWGDGSADETFTLTAPGSLGSRPHAYATVGAYTVEITVTDVIGDQATATLSVDVRGSAPTETATATEASTPTSTASATPTATLSAGCARANEPTYDRLSNSASAVGSFDIGDTLTISAGPPTTFGVASEIRLQGFSQNFGYLATSPFPGIITYTFTASESTGVGWSAIGDANVTWSVTCTGGELATATPSPTSTPEPPTSTATPTETPTTTATTTATGSVSVHRIDAATGQVLPGGCVAITISADRQRGASSCDIHDGAEDGTTVFLNVPAGIHLLRDTSAPPGYASAGYQEFTVVDGQDTLLTVANGLPATVTIIRTDAAGASLVGGCVYVLTEDGFNGVALACDVDDGAEDGTTAIGVLGAGSYTLRDYTTPNGYVAAADQLFTITAGETMTLTVANRATTATPTETSTATSIATITPTATATSTMTPDPPTATASSTATPMPTATATSTSTPVPTATATPSPTPLSTPVVTAPSNQTANEGASTAIRIGRFTDPVATTQRWSVDVDWGDGTAHTTFTAMAQSSLAQRYHTYGADGVYTVSVSVTNGGRTGRASFTVTVANVGPTLVRESNTSGAEGRAKTFILGMLTDPGTDDNPWTVDVTWGDGGPTERFTTGGTPAGTPIGATRRIQRGHTYVADGRYTVSVIVTDSDGATATTTFRLTVNNIPPTLQIAMPQTATRNVTKTFALGTLTDPGADETQFTVAVNWGDRTRVESYSMIGPATGTPLSLSRGHTYTRTGIYTVSVTVTDSDGGTTTKTFRVTVT